MAVRAVVEGCREKETYVYRGTRRPADETHLRKYLGDFTNSHLAGRYRSVAFGEEGTVKLNQRSELKIKRAKLAAWTPTRLNEQKAAQYLVFASLLARRLD